MALKSLDLSRVEQGIGLGRLDAIVGDVFASAIVREAVPITETQKGNGDGYDVSSATALRFYYDVQMNGATFVDVILKARASEPGGGGVPQTKGTGAGAADFIPRLPQFDDTDQRIKPIPSILRLSANERGCVTIPRPGQAFRVFIQSDNAAAQLGLALQSVLAGGE